MTHSFEERTHAYALGGFGPCIPEIVEVTEDGDEGMDWEWNNTEVTDVDWHPMLTNLPPEKLDYMLASGHHVCRMTLEPVPGTYDRKRRAMEKYKRHKLYGPDVPVMMWEWHVLLSNGEVYRFHTDYSKNEATMARVEPGQVHPPPPESWLEQ